MIRAPLEPNGSHLIPAKFPLGQEVLEVSEEKGPELALLVAELLEVIPGHETREKPCVRSCASAAS